MKARINTTRPVPYGSVRTAEPLDKRISVSMVLDIEVDQVPFHLSADGDSAVISFNSLSDALVIFKKYTAICSRRTEQIRLFREMLSRLGMTICYKNRHFGFIGPKANFILSGIFTFATSLGGRP